MLERREIGERIAERRAAMTMTQDELARLLGIDRPRLSGIERGTRPLDAHLVATIARLLDATVGYLLGTESSSGPQPGDQQDDLRFRAQLARGNHEAELAGLLTFIERYQRLMRWADLPARPPDLPHMPYASNLRHYASEGDATRLRNAWGLGDAPIGLDIFDLLEGRGVGVYRQVTPGDDVSGAYYRDDSIGPVLFVNAKEWPYRQVFTAAHELAHLLYDRQSGYSVKHDSSSEERLCNRFASAFLMPESAIEAHLSLRETRRERIEADDVLSLHRAFGVSFGAMLVRLKTLGILGPRRFGELKNIHPVEEAVTHGYVVATWEYGYHADRVTPEERMAWLPRRYLQLVRRAVKVGYLSDRKAAEYVNMSFEEWLSLTRQAPDGGSTRQERELHDLDLADNEFLVAS